jgi:transposase
MNQRKLKGSKREPGEKKQREKTPTFLLELPLEVNAIQAKRIQAHLEAGRALYNAVLSEGLHRLKRMRNDPGWQEARAIPREQKQKRRIAFSALREQYGFTEYALHEHTRDARCTWIADHLDAVLAQTLATRAYRALNRVCVGQARTVRFKSRGRGLSSIENKRNDTGLRFVLQDPRVGNQGYLIWNQDQIRALIDWNDPVVAHGLRHPIKYARLVVRCAPSERAQGTDSKGFRYFVQLVLKGRPHQKRKHKIGNDQLGLDLGPSTLAMVSRSGQAYLTLFCAELANKQQHLKRLHQQMDRQRRATNSEHYDEKGRVKKCKPGQKRLWKRSKRYEKTRKRQAEIQRKQAAHRKSLHGRLAHQLVAIGNTIVTEKLSYKAWQRQFGRSVGTRAPGMFMEILRRLVASTGGTLIEVSTRATKLSQFCHGCGEYQKKPLSQRVHQCACGVGPIQRDLYSAFLAAFLNPKNLSPSHAQYTEYWEGMETCLRAVWEGVQQRANEGQSLPRSMGIPRARVRLPSSLVEPRLELYFHHGRVEALGGHKNPPTKLEESSGQ